MCLVWQKIDRNLFMSYVIKTYYERNVTDHWTSLSDIRHFDLFFHCDFLVDYHTKIPDFTSKIRFFKEGVNFITVITR